MRIYPSFDDVHAMPPNTLNNSKMLFYVLMRIQKSVIKKKERQGGKELNDMHCILEKSKGISNVVKTFFKASRSSILQTEQKEDEEYVIRAQLK